MKSLLFVKKKKSDLFLLLKKMILICQNIISALWDVKKRRFLMIKIQICFVIKKKWFFDDKNSNMFCYIFLKIFSKKKTSLIN